MFKDKICTYTYLTENLGCCSIIWSIFIWHRKRNVGKVQTVSENVYLNTCPKCNLNDCIKCSFIYIYYHKMCHRLKFNGTVHLQQLGIRPLPGLINVSIFLPGWFKNWLMIDVNRKMFCRFSKWLIPAPGPPWLILTEHLMAGQKVSLTPISVW